MGLLIKKDPLRTDLWKYANRPNFVRGPRQEIKKLSPHPLSPVVLQKTIAKQTQKHKKPPEGGFLSAEKKF